MAALVPPLAATAQVDAYHDGRASRARRPASGPAAGVPLALALVVTTIGLEQLLHTDARSLASLPLYQALHWLSDSLLALPLGMAAVWGGGRLAGWAGVGAKTLTHSVARACLIAVVFALLLVPGAALHDQADKLTHTHVLLASHSHAPAQVKAQPDAPAALASFLWHSLADALAGEAIGLPLLIGLLWWRARTPTRTLAKEIT